MQCFIFLLFVIIYDKSTNNDFSKVGDKISPKSLSMMATDSVSCPATGIAEAVESVTVTKNCSLPSTSESSTISTENLKLSPDVEPAANTSGIESSAR